MEPFYDDDPNFARDFCHNGALPLNATIKPA
jgi:hypothetical protein